MQQPSHGGQKNGKKKRMADVLNLEETMPGEHGHNEYKNEGYAWPLSLYPEVTMTGELSNKEYKNARKCMAAAT
jgi:hypothetical protein